MIVHGFADDSASPFLKSTFAYNFIRHDERLHTFLHKADTNMLLFVTVGNIDVEVGRCQL